MALCLVVEDQERQAGILAGILCDAGHQVICTARGSTAVELARQHKPEVALLDLGLPDADGLDVIPELLQEAPLLRIVVLTGRNSVVDAVRALRAGARHYLVKPWDRDELLLIVEREAGAVDGEESRLREKNAGLFWGSALAMTTLRARLDKLAASSFTPVLIEGETGTGKEVVARELHRAGRAEGQFVALNCAAVPGSLLESELFGHERGAFTGAETRRRGVVELARNGTLFLDEIAEMAAGLQAKLLRFLEDHSFRRVGGEEEMSVVCRVIAATHQDLDRMVAAAEFRRDLFYRLAVVRLTVPPLRERGEDLLPLSHWLVRELARALGRTPKPLSPAAEVAILRHTWPGNVRELRNRLERALVLGEDTQIQVRDLDLALLPAGAGALESIGDAPARLRALLRDTGWNVAKAARRLGVERHWLKYRMEKFGIRRADKK